MERAGAVFAPIPSLRSCAAYRPAALRRRNRQAACAKKAMDQAHAWGSPGHCDRIRALEKLEIVPYYVSRAGPSRSQSTKSTETTKSKLRKGSRGYDQSL